jgi:hypothetical protein
MKEQGAKHSTALHLAQQPGIRNDGENPDKNATCFFAGLHSRDKMSRKRLGT